MSSIRLFKKEINNIVGSYLEEVYDWELNHPDADPESTEQLIDKSIALFDDLIEKIHQAKRQREKEGFKALKEHLNTSIDALQKELTKLG